MKPILTRIVTNAGSLAAALLLSTLNSQLSTLHAQSTAFTYQGRVTDNGTNFNGNGLFKFALVTSTNTSRQATATATVNGGFVTAYNVTDGGNGYTAAPAVTVSGGGGSGATATASVGGGAVTGLTPNNPGSGYTGTPTATIAPPPNNPSYTTYWSNDGTSVAGSEPSAGVSLSVASGLFTVELGDTTLANMTATSASLFAQPNLQLRIWFSDGVNGFAALSPVQDLTPAPYAIVANSASNLLGTLLASQLSGTLALGQLPAGLLTNNQSGVSLTGSFTGNGTGLSALDATQLASGTIADARLSTNVAMRAGGNTFTGDQVVTNGNVGIGTTSPQALFNVDGTIRWGGTTADFAFSGEDGSGLFLEEHGSSLAKSTIRLQSSTSGDLNNYSQFFIDPANGFSFMSLGTGNGNVGIGTTTPSAGYALDVNGTARIRTNLYVGNYPNAGYLQVEGNEIVYGILQVNNGLTVNNLSANGSVLLSPPLCALGGAYKPGGGSWSVYSDERLKQNIRPLTGVLDQLLALRGVSFEFKEPEKIHELPGERIGMIAQEVERVFSDWVETGADGFKRLTYRGFEALTVEALRDLRTEKDAQITALQSATDAMLGVLEMQNEKLQRRLEQLEQLMNEKNGGAE